MIRSRPASSDGFLGTARFAAWHTLALPLILTSGCFEGSQAAASEGAGGVGAGGLGPATPDGAGGMVGGSGVAGTGGGATGTGGSAGTGTLPIELIEPVAESDYYVRNERGDEINLGADGTFGPVALLVDTVAAGAETHIFHAREEGGGHAFPSNFFGNFTVRAAGEVIYEGVVDEDWQQDPLVGVGKLVLIIEAEVTTSEQVDYGCQTTEDCSIEDVGNCCGYFPRCVHVDSPLPPPDCSGGEAGVCGFPDITHCACVENTCRSMQGDTEV
ncbi:MAG: hypothetical protein OEZ06_22870 [Myxococcales bacterium]|nr:hypothetical protein [Myxococcales bacterium]